MKIMPGMPALVLALAVLAPHPGRSAAEAATGGLQQAGAGQESPQDAEETSGTTSVGAGVSSSGAGVGVTSRRDRFFFGGGVGMGFGDVTYVELWPLLGYNFHPQVRGGVTLIYRYNSYDKDYLYPGSPSNSTNDYGGSVFADYFPVGRLFLRAEYEHLSYEYIEVPTYDTFREGYDSVFGGVGYANPIGPNGFLNIMLLYNFTYDRDDLYSPYNDPYVVRLGVSFGF